MEKELEKELEKQIGIGKAKVGLVVCAVLVVIFAISSIWLYTRIDNLQNQMGTLETEKSSLETQVSELQADKSTLESQVNTLQNSLDSLASEYNDYVANHHYTDDEYIQACFFILLRLPSRTEVWSLQLG